MKRKRQTAQQPPETPVDQYRIYRGLSKTDLGKMARLSRTTIEEACFGTRTLTDSSLKDIAAALCVDTSDLAYTPSDPLKDVYDISQAMADIHQAISLCAPRQLEKKAAQIIAYLSCDDRNPAGEQDQNQTCRAGRSGRANRAPVPDNGRELTRLETAVDRLLSQISDTGISLIAYHLKYIYREIPAADRTFVQMLDSPFQSLDYYRKQRDLNIEELEHLSGISRQTLLKLRKGQKPSPEQLGKLAGILQVESVDLIRGLPLSAQTCPSEICPARAFRVVDIRSAAKAVQEAVRRCKPSLLRVRVPHILAYLKNTNGDLANVMAYLLTPSSQEQGRLAISYTEVLCKYSYFRRDHTPYIYIGYCPSEYEEHVYDAYILFEEWVYSMFCLDYPLDEISWDIPDEYNRHVSRCLGLPNILWIEKQPDDEDFETDLLEQIEECCRIDASENIPDGELMDIFCDYLSDSLWASKIEQYELQDMDMERPFRLMKRQEQYQNLLYRLASLHTEADLVETIARHFSWFKEDPEYERKLFEELELGEPV